MLDVTRDDKGMMLLLIPPLVLVAGFSSDFRVRNGSTVGFDLCCIGFSPLSHHRFGFVQVGGNSAALRRVERERHLATVLCSVGKY